MKCFMCKGLCKNDLSTFMVDVDNHIIIVKDVPSQVCSQCGETSYSDDVAAQLERIVAEAHNALSEIAVFNYSARVGVA